MYIVSTKNTNTTATNVTSTVSINCDNKKVIDFYILHTVLLVIILITIITIITITIDNYYPKQNALMH